MIVSEFRNSPIVRMMLFVEDRRFPSDQLMLPAPNPLTVYSRRPLGFMAKPIPEHRRPKGYVLPQNYSRPADCLAYQARYGHIFST